VQAWNGFDPGAQPDAAGASYLEAATATGFNLEDGTTDIFAGVLFKLGPRAAQEIASPFFQVLFSNFGFFTSEGWILGIGPAAYPGLNIATGNNEVSFSWPITFPPTVPAAADPSGPTLHPSADRLIFAVMHLRDLGEGSIEVELYINGGRVAFKSGVGAYTPSTIKPSVGYAPVLSPTDPNGQTFAEIAGVCFSHMTIPAGPTYEGDVASLMDEAWRTARAANAIASLTADNRLDWDHRWNASATPTPPIIGPNGFPYVVSDPPATGPIADEGNTGGFAAPAAGPPVALAVIGTDLTVTTTDWPDWFSWQLPWPGGG
jgi:hypothetical protein